ncbi:MAG: SMP-30/gluconolactonase/LRE family protein [Bauldia sp.]
MNRAVGDKAVAGIAEAAGPAATATKALRVLSLIGDAEGPLRFRDIAQLAGLPKATLHRMLSALIESGLISYDPEGETYWLGMRIVDLANKVWETLDLRGAAERELARLRQLSGETAQLGMLDGMHVVYLDERASLQEVRVFYRGGRRLPAYCTALGKVMLAHLPQQRQYDLVFRNSLTAYTPRTLTTLPDLEREFALIRERSYAIEDEELEVGRRSVAAPIFEHGGEPLAAIAITGPADRLTLDECHRLSAEVIGCAQRIRPQAAAARAPASRPLRSKGDQIRCVLPAAAFLGDSPVWSAHEQSLYWVDILEPAVHTFDPDRGVDRATMLPSLVGAVALREQGGLVLALQTGFHLMDAGSAVAAPLGNPEPGLPRNRFNDGKCDRRGRFWAGTMSMIREPSAGNLYRLDPNGAFQRMDQGYTLCNGIDWSPDDATMYVADSVHRTIYAYDFDVDAGSISRRRPFIEIPESRGALGGITVDAEGFLWCPLWDGASIVRVDPAGRIERTIQVAVPRPTGVTFGGDELRTLYVTSARLRLSSRDLSHAPLSGSIFAFEPGPVGLPASRFAG